MPYKGALLAALNSGADVNYDTALKWGSGINPIHSSPDQGRGRGTAIDGSDLLVPSELTEGFNADDFGYQPEDGSYYTWYPAEAGHETGMDDRPPWQGAGQPRQSMPDDYPSPGYHVNGLPGGEHIRSIEKGAIASNTPNQVPSHDVAEGWQNKRHGEVIEPGSGISDPVQYVMQTSMQQLRRTRAGSQSSGTASLQDAPIETRVPGQKLKIYSGGQRHYDMFPKQQGLIIRPFWSRTAGTDDPAKMDPNAMYVSDPLSRSAPVDPYQGPTVPSSETAATYGYTSEDWT